MFMAINDLSFERLDVSDDFLGRLYSRTINCHCRKTGFWQNKFLAARIINNLAINDGVSVALFSLESYRLYKWLFRQLFRQKRVWACIDVY